jgi:hypothetical protein
MKQTLESIKHIYYFTIQELNWDEEDLYKHKHTYMFIDNEEIDNIKMLFYIITELLDDLQGEEKIEYSVSCDRPSGKIKSYDDLRLFFADYMLGLYKNK